MDLTSNLRALAEKAADVGIRPAQSPGLPQLASVLSAQSPGQQPSQIAGTTTAPSPSAWINENAPELPKKIAGIQSAAEQAKLDELIKGLHDLTDLVATLLERARRESHEAEADRDQAKRAGTMKGARSAFEKADEHQKTAKFLDEAAGYVANAICDVSKVIDQAVNPAGQRGLDKASQGIYSAIKTAALPNVVQKQAAVAAARAQSYKQTIARVLGRAEQAVKEANGIVDTSVP